MPAPINEQILDNIKTVLAGVTVANGYTYTMRQVLETSEVAQTKFTHGYPSCDVFIESEIKDDTMDMGLKHCTLNVVIGAFVDDPNDPGQYLSYLCADIEKALMVDHTRGALAIDTEIQTVDRVYVNDRTSYGFSAFAEITVVVKYRHSRANPYSLR